MPKQEEQGASKPPAHFLEEERDYSLVTPGVPGRVLQRRRKEEMLRMPTASVNEATAAEATKGKRRPLLEELRRQLAVADMRLRVWMIDGLIEWALWLRSTAARAPQPKGEELAEKQLHLTDDNEGQHQGAPVVAS